MRVFLFVFILFVGFNSKSDAQRIRYKNLFPILQSKDYKSAEPQLLLFLEDNDDEANAYFYLGEIIVSKLDSVEVFSNTNSFDSMANKAIAAYKNAIKLVDDREVRKNDDYYAAYNRRDLRTGKFAIKVSDIHLDYENKIKEVVNRQELINELQAMKESSVQEYKTFAQLAGDFQSRFKDESAYLLRSNPEDIEASKNVIINFKEFIKIYQEFTEKLNSLNHPAYDPQLKTIQIVNWSGLSPLQTDFSDFSITIQDYDSYLNKLNQSIETEVNPLKDLLFKTEAEFSQIIDQNLAAKDSSEIQKMAIPETLSKGLKEFDENDVILDLLKYKMQKSKTSLLTNVSLHPVLNDSTNIYQRANLIEDYQIALAEQLDIIKSIDQNLSEEIQKDFQSFFEQFKPSIEGFVDTEKTVVEQRLNTVKQKSEMMARQIEFFTNETDSIFLTPLIAATHESKNFVVRTIEVDSMLLVAGQMGDQSFIASAGFNMEIKTMNTLPDSAYYTINNMMILDNNLLVNLESGVEGEDQKRFLKYFTANLEEIWSLEYEKKATLGDAKVEAGIFFIYDQEGNVLETLNSQGEIIGN